MKSILLRLATKYFPFGVGERTKAFLMGLSWSIAAALASRVIAGTTTLFTTRWLGPAEFGEANLALAATWWIMIPIFLGLNTSVTHYVAKATVEDKNQWISEGVKLMAIFAFATTALGYFFRHQWANILGIQENHFLLALIWTFCFWWFTLLLSLLNALEKFPTRSFFEVLFAVLYPIFLMFWIKNGYFSAAYILGLSGAYLLAGIIGLFYLKPHVAWDFHFTHRSKRLLMYGSLCMTAGIILALFESPAKLIANQYFDSAQVGILSAYQSGSTQLAFFFLTATTQVFFPIASRTPDKNQLFNKLNRLMWIGFPFLSLVCLSGLFVYFVLLGKDYPIRLDLSVVYTLSASITIIKGIIIWYVFSFGTRGVILNAIVGLISGIAHVFLCQWAIPHMQILGAGLAYLIASGFGLFLFYLPISRKWLNAK